MAPDLLQQRDDTDRWEEEDWSALLQLIEVGGVIPIIGPDLLQIEVEGKSILLDHYLARQLAHRFSLAHDEESSLNDVVCGLKYNDRRRAYSAVHKFLENAPVEPPKPLLQLAEISHFNLFVTTTFDPYLELAIKKCRGVEPKTIAYDPRYNNDIVPDDLLSPTVYHLLNKSSNLPFTYVISEEDLLEFVHALQSETHRPRELFEELKNKNLLVLGEHFPDWLARFFLRAAKQGRLSDARDVMEILADCRLPSDKNLVLFLQRFSKNTRIFRGGGPIDFVDELWRRWCDEYLPRKPDGVPDEMAPGGVFISYAHEDLATVQVLRDGLIAEGFKVWFDNTALPPATRFNYDIRSYIEEQCSCFVAVLSQVTEKRTEGYFRKEWDTAIERGRSIAHTIPFLVPVVIDGTNPKDFKTLRPEMKEFTITPLPGGRITPELVARLKEAAARFQPS
jgi:hypothetical protein